MTQNERVYRTVVAHTHRLSKRFRILQIRFLQSVPGVRRLGMMLHCKPKQMPEEPWLVKGLASQEMTVESLGGISGESERWRVQKPGGSPHVVRETESGLECDCRGYKYRSACSHVSEIETMLDGAGHEEW